MLRHRGPAVCAGIVFRNDVTGWEIAILSRNCCAAACTLKYTANFRNIYIITQDWYAT